jgi:hypothetical protein
MKRGALVQLAVLVLLAGAARATGEPIFLSRQYSRCTNCHFSATGGGLLTPYGRSLSREELSTFGRSPASAAPGHEQEFLFGLLDGATGPLSLGLDLRPSHLGISAGGFETTRNFLMNAELTAAYRHERWTFYGQLGRQPRGDDTRVTSFEHWIAYQKERGLGVRAGRFIPAYGIRLADHTSFTRAFNDLDNDDQVYGLELSYNGDRHLLQISLGPGLADSVDDAERRAFTASGRWQLDLRPNVVLVASGLFRDASELEPQRGALGLAAGIAPASRLSLFAQADARFRDETSGGEVAYTLLGEAAFEAYRGVWIRLSPQLVTGFGDTSAGVTRLALGLNLLPRTHWNLVLSYYHDRNRETDRSTQTLLAQLHLYL